MSMSDVSWLTPVATVAGIVVGWALNATSAARQRRADQAEREQDRWHTYRRDLYVHLLALSATLWDAIGRGDELASDEVFSSTQEAITAIRLYGGAEATMRAARRLADLTMDIARGFHNANSAQQDLIRAREDFGAAVRHEFGLA